MENGTARKPNRRTLQALLPYLDMLSYEDLLAMAGYSVDFTEKPAEQKSFSLVSEDIEESTGELKNVNPEFRAILKEVYKYLDDPKNLILLQKVLLLIKQIGESDNDMSNETMKRKYLRDCMINILQ